MDRTDDRTGISAAAGVPAGLEGRTVACGRDGCDWLAARFGIDTGSGLSVRAAAWIYNHVEVALTDDRGTEFVFHIEQRQEERPCFVRTERLNIYFRGRDLPAEAARLPETTARGFADLDLGDIGRRLLADPQLGAPELLLPSPIDDRERPANLLDSWGEPDLYANFFAEGEIARGKLDSLDIFNRATFIQHCDAECLSVKPNVQARIVKMVSYPWMKPHLLRTERARSAGGGSGEVHGFSQNRMYTTDLRENDLIMGNPDKLRAVLDAATARQDSELIFFSNTCTPEVAGEDVWSIVRRYQQTSRVPLIYLTVTPKSMEEVFFNIFVTRRLETEPPASPDPSRVNLIGFAQDRHLAGLMRILEAAGVTINAIVLPAVDYAAIRALPNATVNVYYPNSLWSHFYDQLKIRSTQTHLHLAAPYGVEASREWLEQVAAAAGCADRLEPAWLTAFGPLRDEWESLRAAARARRLAFVARGSEIHYLTDPVNTWGVPLLTVAQEMGFGIDIFFQAEKRREAYEAAVKLKALQRDGGPPMTIKGFNSFEMLQQRLAESTAGAVFSSHFFDWRATSAGKGLFSLQDFDLGPDGAVDSLRRLLAVCSTPFYRLFGRFLGRTREGQRHDA